MEDVIQIDDQFYIRATSARIDGRTRVLKRGETFAICDRFGDISGVGLPELGLYHEGTRFLSRLALTLDGNRPMLLSSGVREDNASFVAHLTNADAFVGGHLVVPRGSVHLSRESWTFPGGMGHLVTVRQYGLHRMDLRFALTVDADFVDVFEVRGTPREVRGRLLPAIPDERGLCLSYEGRDGLVRSTRVRCDPAPREIRGFSIVYDFTLEPHTERRFLLTVSCESSEEARPTVRLPESARVDAAASSRATVESDDAPFHEWLCRSAADLQMMITALPSGPYPFAGVPWFCTPFGRDGIVTALETLWMDPDVARGVLTYLSETQATDLVPERDAEPGKVLHEARKGEMAALGEIPFGRYYGSVDATPLFVMLAAAYHERVADEDFLRRIWPHVEAALDWIDHWGDRDGDGFVEYYRQSGAGLVNQGWKDSGDAIFHADGTLAEGPIAVCEVQGYVYAAKQGAARLAKALGREPEAATLAREAGRLRDRFDRAFWCDDLGTYALALDGEKRPCRVRASNAAHALWTGVALPERAAVLARALFEPASFSGWGIRTVAEGESRYNPMSYHDGSVWPHDNAIAAAGLARYGYKELAARLLTSFLEVSREMELRRLPELFCGFSRREGEPPTLYPLACSPQAWAAGAPYLMLAAILGLSVDGAKRRVRLDHPHLPSGLPHLTIGSLRMGDFSVDLDIRRERDGVAVAVPRREGDVEVATESGAA